MTTTPDRFACLDQAHIEAMAVEAAEQLKRVHCAEVELTPGDATRYPIVVLNKGRRVATERGYEARREYLVVLASSFGCSYPWNGQAMHADYCDQKWDRRGNGWTGEVMARFLTALSGYVAESP